MKPPLMICGCPGSGTSLVTKMLRHAGFFAGADAGPVDVRKYHESQCFKAYNEQFLQRTIGWTHAPKSVAQFRDHLAATTKQVDSLVASVDLERVLETFGGNASDWSDRVWGWKDPRNSATAQIWARVFPGARVVAVVRHPRWFDQFNPFRKASGTESGRWFRRRSSAALRRLYHRPQGVDAASVYCLDFDRFISDADYCAQTLAWCGLDATVAQGFDRFLDDVGLER